MRTRFLEKPRILAHCRSTLGHEWVIHSEPLDGNRIGLVIYTARGKAIAAGTGTIQTNGAFRAAVSTLYDGITNRCRCKFTVHAKYSSSDSEWGVAGQVEGAC
jgi:hypothetical protein